MITSKQMHNLPERMPNSFIYVLERDTGRVRCNGCGKLVLKMDKDRAMHSPPKPYECMFCDIEISDSHVTVGDYHTAQELAEIIIETNNKMLLDTEE